MAIKTSAVFYMMNMFTAFLMGSYVSMWGTQKKVRKPTLQKNFDVDQFTTPWYTIMMSNDLPFFTEECGQ